MLNEKPSQINGDFGDAINSGTDFGGDFQNKNQQAPQKSISKTTSKTTSKTASKSNNKTLISNQATKHDIASIFFANATEVVEQDCGETSEFDFEQGQEQTATLTTHKSPISVGHTVQGFLNSPQLGLSFFQHFSQYMRNLEHLHSHNKEELTDELRAEYIRAFFEKMKPLTSTLWE